MTGREIQSPLKTGDALGEGNFAPALALDSYATAQSSLPPGRSDPQGFPQQSQGTLQQPQPGVHAAAPSRKRPKSMSPAPAAAQVLFLECKCMSAVNANHLDMSGVGLQSV